MNEAMVKLALDCGAARAAALPAERIVLNDVFRSVCQSNACGNYGQCYMCPPDAGEIHALMETVRAFTGAVLYQTIHDLEDSFDYEGMTEAGKRHAAVSQALEQALRSLRLPAYLHLSAGGCKVCDVCAKRSSLPCRHPDLAMAGLECYGMDVYQTAVRAGLQYVNGQNTVTYFGMILLGDA